MFGELAYIMHVQKVHQLRHSVKMITS